MPDVERIAQAMANTGANNPHYWQALKERARWTYRRMARTAVNIMGCDSLTAARIKHVRQQCESSIEFDQFAVKLPNLTDRAWLAQSVLNILDGKIDHQLEIDET